MIAIRLPSTEDLVEVIEALVLAADDCEDRAPDLAAHRRALADQLGDGLDALPLPTTTDLEAT